MLVSQLEKDIKLLEKQLEEIDVNISDAIERNEQKKQLKKEIKKLKRSKSQTEQLEQEQQELESLKSEFFLNKNESVTQTEFKIDEPIIQISPITDKPINTESKPNFNQRLEESSSTKAKIEEPKSAIATNSLGIKINYLLVLGLILSFVVTVGLIINYNLNKKAELARQEAIQAKEEAEQANNTTDSNSIPN